MVGPWQHISNLIESSQPNWQMILRLLFGVTSDPPPDKLLSRAISKKAPSAILKEIIRWGGANNDDLYEAVHSRHPLATSLVIKAGVVPGNTPVILAISTYHYNYRSRPSDDVTRNAYEVAEIVLRAAPDNVIRSSFNQIREIYSELWDVNNKDLWRLLAKHEIRAGIRLSPVSKFRSHFRNSPSW